MARKKAFTEHVVSPSFDSPESKLVAGATYDLGQQVLTIHFQAGTTYTYAGINKALWLEFEQATSKGNYFSKVIRPMYAGTLVGGV